MDFRDVALALAALDGGRSLEELMRLAFEVSGGSGAGLGWETCGGPDDPPKRPMWGTVLSSFWMPSAQHPPECHPL